MSCGVIIGHLISAILDPGGVHVSDAGRRIDPQFLSWNRVPAEERWIVESGYCTNWVKSMKMVIGMRVQMSNSAMPVFE